jgi:hypothetical protein
MLSTNILRYKESDRLNAIMVELTKLDAAVNVSDDGDTLTIVPARHNQRPSIPTMTTEWQLPSACCLGRTKSHDHGPWLRVENMAAILLGATALRRCRRYRMDVGTGHSSIRPGSPTVPLGSR